MPLLRIVPVEGKHGDMVSKNFNNVQTLPSCTDAWLDHWGRARNESREVRSSIVFP